MKSGKWMSKTAFLNGFIKEELYMMQPEGFVNPKDANKVCKLQRSVLDWCKHLGVGIYALMSWSKQMVLYRLLEKPVFTRSEWELYSISNTICRWHIGLFERSFSKKDLGKAAYILSIKIYRDRSRRLISFSMSTYLNKILKWFKMEQSKKEFLACVTRCEIE